MGVVATNFWCPLDLAGHYKQVGMNALIRLANDFCFC